MTVDTEAEKSGLFAAPDVVDTIWEPDSFGVTWLPTVPVTEDRSMEPGTWEFWEDGRILERGSLDR